VSGQEERMFTSDDLDAVIIAPGITARNATDRQFFEWADALVAVEISESPEDPWTVQGRVNLCNMLYKMGIIHLTGDASQPTSGTITPTFGRTKCVDDLEK
jgi:hypothetical protein